MTSGMQNAKTALSTLFRSTSCIWTLAWQPLLLGTAALQNENVKLTFPYYVDRVLSIS